MSRVNPTQPPGEAGAAPEAGTPESIIALMREGKLREAEAMAREALESEPDFARVHYYLGVTLYRTRRYEGAVEELGRALAMRPVWGRAHYDLALAHIRLDRLDEADAELKIAEEQAHASLLPSVRAAQADVMARRGDRAGARQLAEQAATISGVTPTLGRLLGELRREEGDLSGSASALRLAIEAAPEDPSLRWALGWTLTLLGRDADAKDQYDLADEIEAKAVPACSWLVSYPKTGATWLRYMLVSAMGRALVRQGLLDDAEPATTDTGSLARRNPAWPRLVWTHDDANAVLEDGSPVDRGRLFVTGARERYRGSRVVFLLRDPRDTVVSAYHQATKRTASPVRTKSLSTFVRDPELGLDRFLRFCKVWSDAIDIPERFEIVTYEQLHANPETTLMQTLDALALSGVTESDCAHAVRAGEAGRMRTLERSGRVHGLVGDAQTPDDALKVRKARVGSYRDELTQRDIAWCDKRIRSAMPALAEPIRAALEASMSAPAD